MKQTRQSCEYLALLAGLALASGFVGFNVFGCVPRDPHTTLPSAETAGAKVVDELTLAFENLRGLNNPAALERDPMRRITGNSSANRSQFYLNQWLARQDVDAVKWELDPMFRNLPRALRDHDIFRGLDQLDYSLPDTQYLQQMLWLNDVAQRTVQEKAPPHLASWLDELEKDGQLDTAHQLRQAERLFDWTVRNIQLQPLLPQPKGPQLNVEEGKQIDNRPPYERGIPGPGYQQLPYQTLQYGQGDAWERGRIFIQLCRQAAIPAAMLGIVQENELGGPQAWVATALIGDELYLFDPQLGFAIPGPAGKGIATLAQFVADDSLRTALDLPDEPYRVSSDDLKNVAVLMDAQPEALSRRMAILEEPLNYAREQSRTEPKPQGGASEVDRLDIVLTFQPSEWEQKFRRARHISSVSLWRVPYEAVLFAAALPELFRQNPELEQRRSLRDFLLNAEQMIYLGSTQTVDRSLVEGQQQRQRAPRQVTLAQGRDYLLRGRFEDLDRVPGARSVYLSFRPSAQDIDLAESSLDYLRSVVGDESRMPKTSEERRKAMQMMGQTMRYSKNVATFWLGVSYFETGEYQNAIQWLEPIATGAAGESEWQAGARYVTARSYEALGKLDKAREFYLADDSPQAAGNQLRAGWLKKRGAESDKVSE